MSVFCKQNTIFNYFITVILSAALLSACGLSGDKGGTNGQPSSNNGSNSNGNQLEDDTFNIKEKIGVRVERINGEINNLSSTTQISIVTLNESFRETGSGSTPSYQVIRRQTGGYEIQLASSYIERLNQVIKVTFNNQTTPKEILYAPLYTLKSDNESITVSAKSHYLLKKLFDTVDTSSQLAQLIPCSNSSITCANQPKAKSNMLEQINTAVTAYNVDIPLSANVTQAVSLLDQRLDLRQHVESAVNEITRIQSPFAKGTRRSFDPISSPITSQYYHSVYFGLSLSDIKPDDDSRTVKVSSSSSTINNSTNNAYPGFNQGTSILDMRRDVLSSDIPFERTNLQIAQNNSFALIDNEEINSLTSALTDSFLSTQGFLLNERVIEQTTSSNNTIGWEFEPLFSRTYITNEFEPDPNTLNIDDEVEPDYGSAPTWLVSSNYSKAASYSLSGSVAPFNRVEQLEDVHLFSWEVHGLETKKDPGFKVSAMNGKEYGVISYSLKLNNESNANVMQFIAETAKWDISSNISSGTISLSQPTSHYKTLSLSRADNNITAGVKTETNLLDTTRTISRLASNTSDEPYHGLISLGGVGSGQPQGHSTTNGSYMSLAFNTKQKSDPLDRGQGIILASELVSFNYSFSDEIYQLQGNSFEINDDKNIIHQLNGSSLEITSTSNIPNIDCQATLSIKRTSVEHTIGTQENTLSAPNESFLNDVFSQSCTLDGSEILIEFSNVFAETLTLRGFITQKNDSTTNKPGNLINLIWQQDNQLGLIFANKEQELSPTFDE